MSNSLEQPAAPAGGGRDGSDQDGNESLLELVAIVAVAVGLALLIQWLLVKPYRIPSASMVPTLEIGQRVLVNRVEGRLGTPSRGDVVVFKPPAGADDDRCGAKDGEEYLPGKVYVRSTPGKPTLRMPCPRGKQGKFSETFIKRVIGMPGDQVKIIGGRAWVNGKQLNEPYISPKAECLHAPLDQGDCTYALPITVPPGTYFMMGDNRDEFGSDDSRYWGPVPENSIIGEAFMTYWPPQRIGGL